MSFGARGWTHPWMITIMWIKRGFYWAHPRPWLLLGPPPTLDFTGLIPDPGFYWAHPPPWLLLDPLHTSQQPHTLPSSPLAGVAMTDVVDLAVNSLPLTVELCMRCLPRGSQAPARCPFLQEREFRSYSALSI